MVDFVKNILFVSYLKNKGIRRLCFILGIFFASFWFLSAVINFDFFQKYRYRGLGIALSTNDVVYMGGSVDPHYKENLNLIYEKYFKNQFSDIKNFNEFYDFFYSKYNKNTFAPIRPYEIMSDYKDSCLKRSTEQCKYFLSLVDREIDIRVESLLSFIKVSVFVYPILFYFPFALCILIKFIFLILKWIYAGFGGNIKQER